MASKKWVSNLWGTLATAFSVKKLLVGVTTDNGTDIAQFNGTVSGTSPANGANNNQLATTAWVYANPPPGLGAANVAPYTLTIGATGCNYTTISGAISSLANVTCTGGVTLQIKDQEITEPNPIVPPSTFFGRILITSLTPVAQKTTQQLNSIGGQSGDVWQVSIGSVGINTILSVGDWVMFLAALPVGNSPTTERPHRFNGYHEVTAVPTANQFSIKLVTKATSYANVPTSDWTTWNSTSIAYKLYSRIKYTGTGYLFDLINPNHSLSITGVGMICSNTANTGGCIRAASPSWYGRHELAYVGIAGFQRGIFADIRAYFKLNGVCISSRDPSQGTALASGIIAKGMARVISYSPGCSIQGAASYGIYTEGNSRYISWYSTITLTGNAGTGMYVYTNSMCNIATSNYVEAETFYGCTGSTFNLALNTVGNKNSWIIG